MQALEKLLQLLIRGPFNHVIFDLKIVDRIGDGLREFIVEPTAELLCRCWRKGKFVIAKLIDGQ